MNDDSGFLQAIRDNPDDDTHRLIYADWLEERGDVRGEYWLSLSLVLSVFPWPKKLRDRTARGISRFLRVGQRGVAPRGSEDQ